MNFLLTARNIIAVVLTTAGLSSGAFAQGVGTVYWGLAGGAQFYNDNEIGKADLEFDPGFMFGGQLGYIFGSVRAEGELAYSEADVEIGRGKDTLTSFRGTGSLYFDFIGFGGANILPYAGGGFGFAALEFDDDIDDSETVLTAHAELGISLAALSNFDVVFAYRFEYYDTEIGDVDDDITAHQARIALRFFPQPSYPICC
ncbi:MAG: outer membrane beta-barrel protein [Geminicoccaceae bacterium]